MRLVEDFNDFLENNINLNKTRIEKLESTVETIKSFIKNSDYSSRVISFSKQGSWAHKTIIKPVNDNDEFDADLVVFVKQENSWEPKDYIYQLRKIFKNSERYSDMTSSKSRCVTLDYSGDFHLDIVPIIEASDSTYWVCNCKENNYEKTDGNGFKEWWLNKNILIPKDHLIKVTKLLKYLRNSKKTFSAKSILLTTLIGSHIYDIDQYDKTNFEDIPSALKTIITRLNNTLKLKPLMPSIKNPCLAEEEFTRHWDQDKYENFRKKIQDYTTWVEEAYYEEDEEKSIKKWQKVFGTNFGSKKLNNKSLSIIRSIAEKIYPGKDLIDTLKVFKKQELFKSIPEALPHVQKLKFKEMHRTKTMKIDFFEVNENGEKIREVLPYEILEKQKKILFVPKLEDGSPLPLSWEVKWQIVNNDQDAYSQNCLRGNFDPANGDRNSRFEITQYRGIHWVKVFAIQKIDNKKFIAAKSGRLFVNVN